MKFTAYDAKGNKFKEIDCRMKSEEGYIAPNWYEIKKKEYFYEYKSNGCVYSI